MNTLQGVQGTVLYPTRKVLGVFFLGFLGEFLPLSTLLFLKTADAFCALKFRVGQDRSRLLSSLNKTPKNTPKPAIPTLSIPDRAQGCLRKLWGISDLPVSLRMTGTGSSQHGGEENSSTSACDVLYLPAGRPGRAARSAVPAVTAATGGFLPPTLP